MGVEFRWEAGDSGEELPSLEPARRQRIRSWSALIPLAIVLALGGAVAWRAGDGERAAREDLQRVVEQEVAVLQAGQSEALDSLLTGTPLYWRRYHEVNVFRELAWYAARGTARVRVERVRLEPGRAIATIALDDGHETRRATWYYARVGEAWRHAPPPTDSWGEAQTLEAPHVSVRAAGPDLELVEGLPGELEALYSRLAEAYGSPPELLGRPAPVGVSSVPSHITVEVTASVTHVEWKAHVGGEDGGTLQLRAASPQLALELWTPEERRAYLGRTVRVAVAQHVIYNSLYGGRGEPPWALVEGLILWQARAWEPEWEPYLRASLVDGTAEQFLGMLDGDEEAARFFEELAARVGSEEEALLGARALSYRLGELLGTRFLPEEMLPFLRNAGGHDTLWGALEAELRLSRGELEEAWRAHLRACRGVGVTGL